MKINSIQDYFAFIGRDEQFDPASPNYLGFINIDPSVDIHNKWIGMILNHKDDPSFLEMVNQYGLKLTRVTPTELIISESAYQSNNMSQSTIEFVTPLRQKKWKRLDMGLNELGFRLADGMPCGDSKRLKLLYYDGPTDKVNEAKSYIKRFDSSAKFIE